MHGAIICTENPSKMNQDIVYNVDATNSFRSNTIDSEQYRVIIPCQILHTTKKKKRKAITKPSV